MSRFSDSPSSRRGPLHNGHRLKILLSAGLVAFGLSTAGISFAESQTPLPAQILVDEAMDDLLPVLKSSAPMSRRLALLQGVAAHDLQALAPIAGRLTDPSLDLPLRAAGIEILSRFPADQVRPLLEKLAEHDKDPIIHALALEALRVIDPPRNESLDELENRLAQALDPADRRAIANRLGALEDPRAQDVLWRIAEDSSEHPLVVATAIEGLHLPSDRPELKSRLQASMAKHRGPKTSSAVLQAFQLRLNPSNDLIPGEIVH